MVKEAVKTDVETLQIGVSRPPLLVDDLPTPEEVFHVKTLDWKNVIMLVLGPSMIALGASIGSGEWLLGPLAFATYGFKGIGWLITIAAVLQTFYNMEMARFTVATGEVPAVAFNRFPPGKILWVPATLILIYLGWIWGGWASTAGQSLFAFFAGKPPIMDAANPANQIFLVRTLGVVLMILSLGMFMFGKKVSQTLETFSIWAVWLVLAFVIIAAVLVVPLSYWGQAFASAVIPAKVPQGMDVILLGGIIGYTGFGAGFNFMLINYYRDKGYGMGQKVGYISGLVGGEKKDIKVSGVTFRESPTNAKLWSRWWRYLTMDQWGVFFIGAMLGMFIPSMLVAYLATTSGVMPKSAEMPTFLAERLGAAYGQWLFLLTLLIGAFTLFKTQATVLEFLIRNTTDSLYSTFPKLHEITGGDARKFYYPIAIAMIVVIAILIYSQFGIELVKIAANMANLAMIIYPFVIMYLNSKLPRPARAPWWSYVVLVLNVLFFGFFFVNFVGAKWFGGPFITF